MSSLLRPLVLMVLTSAVAAPYALAADNTSIFVSNSTTTNQIMQYPIFGGAPITLMTFGDSATGGGLVTDKPDSPHLLIPKMRAEVLCAVADNDDKRDPTAKDKLKAAFAAAHLTATIEVYKSCNHGWTVRGSQVYNEEGAERAWTALLALYKRNLA